MEYDASSIYEDVKLLLKDSLNEIAYDSWFRNLHPLTVDGKTLILESAEPLAKRIIATKYADLFMECLQKLNYNDLTFEIVDPGTYTPKPEKNENLQMEDRIRNANLDSRYTFDQFV